MLVHFVTVTHARELGRTLENSEMHLQCASDSHLLNAMLPDLWSAVLPIMAAVQKNVSNTCLQLSRNICRECLIDRLTYHNKCSLLCKKCIKNTVYTRVRTSGSISYILYSGEDVWGKCSCTRRYSPVNLNFNAGRLVLIVSGLIICVN